MARFKHVLVAREAFDKNSVTRKEADGRIDLLLADSIDLYQIRAKLAGFLAMDDEDKPGSTVEASSQLWEWLTSQEWRRGFDMGDLAAETLVELGQVA